ncbi:DivIVA domain-containing protein [Demequina sp. SYSU T00192]|uniref:Cell wall synthesis protein Wag31 n=1 Tax=Demequina litoralis TaxID=3051660 RepID=A0ABT8GAN9_9MICO|nr:DivIVA domain-containing protein [Demequina sp. SYSU T00192]MDN4476196.1 DivIVA domain-containing protein [Demequina sp. SYSU T00192]
MALLTAEDVLNKAFSKTKYREGFDQDEVDDFLDEVAATIAQLTQERDELAAKVQEGGVAPAPAEPTQETGLLQAATDVNPPTPTGMLAMAQKLHDEYVAAGEEEKERLVEEGKAKAESIVERAETDAQARMDELTTERSLLETKIDDLRRFERDYRARLKSYLSNLLGDLDHAEGTAPAPVASFVGEELVDDEPEAAEEDFAAEAPAESADEGEGEGEEAPEAAAEESEEAADEAAEEDAEEPHPFAPVTGMTPKLAEQPYQPQATQYGTPYTPQSPWSQPSEGDEEKRD